MEHERNVVRENTNGRKERRKDVRKVRDEGIEYRGEGKTTMTKEMGWRKGTGKAGKKKKDSLI